MRRFVKVNTGKSNQRPTKKQRLDFEQLDAIIPERRSPRSNLVLSTKLVGNRDLLVENFTGYPPDGAVRWTKLTLFLYLQQLEDLKVKKNYAHFC